jgi:hypothetical protein
MTTPGRCLLALAALCTFAAPLAGQVGRSVRPTEPNNTAATATPATLGDTLLGSIDPRRDLDWFVLDLPAGSTLFIDRGGSQPFIEVSLWNPDASDALLWMYEYGPPVAEYRITTAGRYYILISRWDHDDSDPRDWPTPEWTYAVRVADTPIISVEQVTRALLDPANALSSEAASYLDLHGNHNGILDVGDLRAYLRAQGRLPASAQRTPP